MECSTSLCNDLLAYLKHPLFIAKGVPIHSVLTENERKKCHSTCHIKICSHKYSLVSFSSIQKMKQRSLCQAEARAARIQVDKSVTTASPSADNFSWQASFWADY